jgi:NADH:ubiquinone oxidoreductase subunit 5 (subunit L)/multisubunit Na+/H+ antiporter MnhA subunit
MLVFLYVGLGTANQQLLVQVTTNSHLFLSQVINVSLYLDFFSANFILLTSFLTTVILLYSYNYMKGDVYVNTFSSMISFFAISMVTLLFAGNFFTVVLG